MGEGYSLHVVSIDEPTFDWKGAQSDTEPGDSSISILRCGLSVRDSMRGIDTRFPNIDLELLMPNRTKYELLLRSIEADFHAEVSYLQDLLVDAAIGLGSILHRLDLRLFVECGLRYESLDAFAEDFHCGECLTQFEDCVLKVRTLGLLFVLRVYSENLVSPSWLNHSPGELSGEVNKVLADIKEFLKALYWVPQHRPLANRDRDRRLWELKRAHPNWSWGRLARHFKISDGAAELAYKRQARRERRRLEELHRAAMWLKIISSRSSRDVYIQYAAGKMSASDFACFFEELSRIAKGFVIEGRIQFDLGEPILDLVQPNE